MWFWKIGRQGRINFFVPSGNVKNVFYITSLSFPTQTLEPFYNILDILFVCEIGKCVYLLKNTRLKFEWKIILITKKWKKKLISWKIVFVAYGLLLFLSEYVICRVFIWLSLGYIFIILKWNIFIRCLIFWISYV